MSLQSVPPLSLDFFSVSADSCRDFYRTSLERRRAIADPSVR